ncbi:MAG: phosphomannomutase/phosphoglucomutase [Phycisphaerales bacterium]|jgi:phosphomannomutase|nr:phosphomannomutase/phosphoglucomutase [Phycisphaeraceae bacterium]
MLGKVFKAYDVRGTYPDPLNEQMAWQIGYGSSRFLLGDAAAAGEESPMMKNIVVGRDMRKSSPSLSEALIKGVCDQGGNVLDVGMVDTSFIYFAVNHLDCAGGIMCTASHNPPQYNGFKISKRRAKPVGEATGLADVRKFAATVDKQTMTPAGGRHEKRDLWEAYRKHVLSFLDLSKRKGKKPLKVVIDASNGMAGTMIPKVFGSKKTTVDGLEIIEINFDNSKGEFAHEPNPLVASNVKQTQDAVIANKADVGFCYDGDADRCVAVDEKGRIIGCDLLTSVLAKFFLEKHPGSAVVFDLRSTKAVSEDITKAGGKPVRGRVGHVFMKAAMAEHKACFGGELSGHFYFSQNFNADSGAIAMATVLSVLASTGKTLSDLVAPAARYVQSGEINFQIEDKDAALARLKEHFATAQWGATIDELDGVTIDCFSKSGPNGGWWCNVRKSNTEPLLRLNLEAKDRKILDAMYAQIAPMLGTKVDH